MLAAGTTLGPYEILTPLGAGGMGEVYRAHDSRFEREARTISQLAHPNICALYDVGRQGEIEYLVMELLEGETLGARLAKCPLPVADVLRLGAEIASALARAHAAGVVHRDLKPGNVMLTKSGAKLMDFGLARVGGASATSPSGSSSAVSGSPTMTQPLTREGTIVGTFEYMAPEQLEGKDTDARADIWALGCVLYEMATGQRAFAGNSQASLIAAIMDREPHPMAEVQPLTPPALQHVVARCLAKDPAERWQSANDLAFSLKAIHGDGLPSSSGMSASAAGHAPLAAGKLRPSRVRVALLVGVPAIVLAAGVAWMLTQTGPPRIRQDIAFHNLSLPTPDVTYPGLSPDGKWVVFGAGDNSGGWDLYFSSVSGGPARRITQDSSAAIDGVAISPDGERIVYAAQDRRALRWGIRTVPVLGGESRLIHDYGGYPRWSPDGRRIVFTKVQTVASKPLEYWTVDASGNDAKLESRDSTYLSVARYSSAWSPDGRQLVMIKNRPQGQQVVVIKDLRTGAERALTHERENIDDVWWSVPNTVFFSSNRGGNINLWAVRGSGGPAVQVTKGGGPDLGVQLSADGRTLLFYQERPLTHLWTSPLAHAEPSRVTDDEVSIAYPSLSPDGKQIAATIYGGDEMAQTPDVFVMNADGSGRRALTHGDQRYYLPAWSPDGRWLAYAGRTADVTGDSAVIFVTDPAAASAPVRLGYGRPLWWTSPGELLTHTVGHGTLAMTLDGRSSRQSPDSTIISARLPAGRVLYLDLREATKGLWLGRSESPNRLVALRQVLPYGAWWVLDRGGTVCRYVSDGRIARLDPVTGRETPVPGSFSGLTTRSMSGVSADGRTLLYTEAVRSTRVVVGERVR